MKYAIVTGSSNGIGLSIARKLISKGYFVFLNGRGDFVPDFPKDRYYYIKADVSEVQGITCIEQAVLTKTDKIDVLVLNVGTTCRKEMSDITYDDWQKVMNTNVNMPFFIVQRFLPYISTEGSILAISSAMGIRPHATSIPYGVSKAALISLVQNLVKELHGIRINCICPGFVDTDWQMNKPEWLRKKILSKIALKRFANPDEVADMCLSVIQNTYMNGAIVNIDGGYDME